jgi:hypothetical protein
MAITIKVAAKVVADDSKRNRVTRDVDMLVVHKVINGREIRIQSLVISVRNGMHDRNWRIVPDNVIFGPRKQKAYCSKMPKPPLIRAQ